MLRSPGCKEGARHGRTKRYWHLLDALQIRRKKSTFGRSTALRQGREGKTEQGRRVNQQRLLQMRSRLLRRDGRVSFRPKDSGR